MTATLRLAPTGMIGASPAAVAAPTCRVNPVVRVALYLYVLSIPFEIPQRSIPLEIPTLTGFLFLGLAVLQPTAALRRIPAPLLWFVAHLYVLAAAAILVHAEHVGTIAKHFVGMVQLLALYWVIVNLMADPRVTRGVLIAIVIAVAVRAGFQVFGIATTSLTVWTGGQRVTVLGQNANLSAMILSAGLVTVAGLRATHAEWLPRFGLLTWPLAALMGLATIQTGSRGGLLCAGVGLLILCFTGSTPGRRIRNALLGGAALVLLGVGATRSVMMRHRIEAATGEGNLAGREKIYPAALEMVRERPLLGWGPVENQYEVARRIQERQRITRDVHNLVLELLTTSGLIGALPFLVGLGLVLRSAWRARRGALGVLPLAVLAAVLMGTISGTWLSSKILWLALALATAAALHWTPDPREGWEGGAACAG